MNYRDFLQKVIYVIINPIIKAMIRLHITPNIVTFIGFIGNIVAAGFFVEAALTQSLELLGWGGLIILAAGLFDMMDGRLARMSGKSSLFGALWDSTLDRYSELVSLFGICLYFLRMQDEMGFWMGIVTFAAMIGSVMVSYVRARAEGLGTDATPRTSCSDSCHSHAHRLHGRYMVACRRYDSHSRTRQHHSFLAHSTLLHRDE